MFDTLTNIILGFVFVFITLFIHEFSHWIMIKHYGLKSEVFVTKGKIGFNTHNVNLHQLRWINLFPIPMCMFPLGCSLYYFSQVNHIDVNIFFCLFLFSLVASVVLSYKDIQTIRICKDEIHRKSMDDSTKPRGQL